MTKSLMNRLKAFRLDTRGNVAFIAAVAFLPMAAAVGMGVDFTNAARRQDQLTGIADAAALSAVTPSMLQQTDSVAQAQATKVFQYQAAALGYVGTVYNLPTPVITDSIDPTSGELIRTATVSYQATSKTTFASLWGQSTIKVFGSSTAKSGIAPNINFYLLVDTSPSMEIAATSAGVGTLVEHTQKQTSDGGPGCAFGCHESNGSSGELSGNPVVNGVQEDNYALSRSLGLQLRIDEVNTALNYLFTNAPAYAAENNTTYNATLYTIDINLTNVPFKNGATTVAMDGTTTPPSLAALEYYSNNNPTATTSNNDEASNLDSALQQMNTIMPTPGTGTISSTPEEVLLIITDGLNDYGYNGGREYYGLDQGPVSTVLSPNGAWCTTIKKRGIRIAVLYLTYVPLTGSVTAIDGTTVSVNSSWYNSYVKPVQPGLAAAAQTCASPGLYEEVDNNGDISSGLTALFQLAVSSAYLTK